MKNRKEQKLKVYNSSTKTFGPSSSMDNLDEEQPLISQDRKPTLRQRIRRFILREPVLKSRTIYFNRDNIEKFPANVIRNQKYNPFTFLFVVLYEQFRFFFNAYFLVVALSQFIPALQVGFLFTYVSPLVFVLSVTIAKEAWDDIKRWMRDKEANSQKFHRLSKNGLEYIPSSDIKVGDLIVVETDQRVPADMILLRTTEKTGSCFVRTDQLDGETDWKLRRAVGYTQKLAQNEDLLQIQAQIYAEKPKKDIYSFIGNFEVLSGNNATENEVESLSAENCLWANTVVASGKALGMVIYTGSETRSVMNTSQPKTKVGSIDYEINRLSKVLCGLLLVLSFVMIALKGFHGLWYIYFFRYMLLFSAIIPISLRVNLDMAKTLYSFQMMRDKEIPGTVVRSSTIPEELGRIDYLLSDKTGTLTQNGIIVGNALLRIVDMVFKKLHVGSASFSKESLDEVETYLEEAYSYEDSKRSKKTDSAPQTKIRRTSTTRVKEAIRSIALCHNVTPVIDEDKVTYQASSPDEVALVKFSESVHLTLTYRDVTTIRLKNIFGDTEEYDVLAIFPFTSETKRMGIIIRDKPTGVINFYMKGADAVMAKIVQYNNWLEEECDNMAREGLRTLVFGKKVLTEGEYEKFLKRYTEAKTSIKDRDANIQKAVESIETELELLCLTGVEDKLQENVKPTLEMLAHAGIKVWMLTGDKMETAKCIAISTRLVSRNQSIFSFAIKTKTEAAQQLATFSGIRDSCLLIDGTSLQICIDNYKEMFITLACRAPCVVCCRCSPTQKAEIVKLIKDLKGARTAAIGDGGNDVSMIQAADVGIGIVGKEGKQASLAADFSINQFSYVSRLLIWHGRNSYKRSARLSQFIIHRGLIISFIQAVFSALFYFAAIAIYNGWLLVGYATFYTNAPVFSLVLDEDVPDTIAFRYPELYKELQKGRVLSFKTFFIWTWTSVYQGGVIMLMSLFLFESNLINIVTITFTALILTELLNVAFEIHRWNKIMVLSELLTLAVYFISMLILRGYFDIRFILSWDFLWRVLVLVMVACLPLYFVRFIKRRLDPPSYLKLQ